MNKNLNLKLIQVVMLITIFLQTLTPIVQCRVIATEQLPMYVVKPTTTSQMTQAQLNTVLKGAPAIPSEYTVSEPISIYTQVSGDLVEDNYYPIVSKGKITGLIRYHTATDNYEMEKEAVVKAFNASQFMTADTSALLLLDIDGAIIAKDLRGSYNLSNAEMTESDIQNLVSKIDLTKLNLEQTQDIYTPNQTLTAKPTEVVSEPTVDPQADAKAVDETKVTSQAENQAVVDVLSPETDDKQVWQKQAKGLTAPGALVRSSGPENINYSKGLVAGTDYISDANYASLEQKDLYFLIKSKDGKYAYGKSICTPSLKNYNISIEGIDCAFYTLLGGDQGNGRYIGNCWLQAIQFQFKPAYYTYYASYNPKYKDPYQGKSLNDLINWLNFWTDNEITIVKMSRLDMEHHVLNLNTGIKFNPGKVNYSKGLDATTDYDISSQGATLKNDNLYFLIKSKDSRYAYTKSLYTTDYKNYYITKTGLDCLFYNIIGGDQGSGKYIGSNWLRAIQFQFKPEYYSYYASYKPTDKNGYLGRNLNNLAKNPYQGKSLNDLINWLHYWTDNEITIVKMSRSDMEHHVLNLNTGVAFKPGKVNYSKGLDATTDYDISSQGATLKNDNLYFLIKSKDSRYAYTKSLYTTDYKNYYITKTGLDCLFYNIIGGDQGSGKYIGSNWLRAIQFQFKPEYYSYYASYKPTDKNGYLGRNLNNLAKNPYQGQSLNDLINWLNFWTDNEISLVKESEIDLFVAKKNHAIKDWQFFKEGRTSSKDQFYSLSLDKTTRLNVSATGAPYQKLTVYNKQKQRYFEMTYTNFYGFSDVLDLPAGEYYISLTNVHNKTTFQMTKSLFSEYDLSVETSDKKTDVYLNNKFNQALTNIYKPFHKKSGNTVTDVFNRLAYEWSHIDKPNKALDQLFGSDRTVKLPQLQQLKIKNLGALPLGNSLRTQSMQYIGKNNFYSNNTIFQARFTPQQRIIGVDDLVVIGVIGGIALYAAFITSQTQTSSSMTVSMPSLQLPSFGSWSGDDDFEYHDTFAYDSKTYGINENTGEIKDIYSGEDFPEQIISKALRAEIPKVSSQAIRQAIISAKIDIPNGYRWYTVKDLIEDEAADWQSSGGHTIAKHISKSDAYLINRAKTTNVSIASSYDTVLQALIAINLAKIKHMAQFTAVSTKQVFSVKLGVLLGKGFDKNGACYTKMKKATVVILPDKSQKGFRVQTSYPTR